MSEDKLWITPKEDPLAKLERFWISTNNEKTWNEVNLEFWIAMEQACGFHGPLGRRATSYFSAGAVTGTMHDPHGRKET